MRKKSYNQQKIHSEKNAFEVSKPYLKHFKQNSILGHVKIGWARLYASLFGNRCAVLASETLRYVLTKIYLRLFVHITIKLTNISSVKKEIIHLVHKIFRKTNISYPLIHTRIGAYHGARNVSYSRKKWRTY